MKNFDLKKYLTEGKLYENTSYTEKQEVLKDLIEVYDPEVDEPTYNALIRLQQYIDDIITSDFY